MKRTLATTFIKSRIMIGFGKATSVVHREYRRGPASRSRGQERPQAVYPVKSMVSLGLREQGMCLLCYEHVRQSGKCWKKLVAATYCRMLPRKTPWVSMWTEMDLVALLLYQRAHHILTTLGRNAYNTRSRTQRTVCLPDRLFMSLDRQMSNTSVNMKFPRSTTIST